MNNGWFKKGIDSRRTGFKKGHINFNKINPNKKAFFNCDLCSKEFEEYKSNLKNQKNKFCSMNCRNSFYSQTRKKFFGENKEYKSIHKLIGKIKGKAKQCILCGSIGGQKGCDWANIDNNYSINPQDYISLCRRCHINIDMGNINREVFYA